MKKFKIWILVVIVVALLAGSFGVGILVGLKYGDFNRLPFVAGGEWAVGIYAGSTPFDLAPVKNLSNPVIAHGDVTDMPARQVADPFMVHEDSAWYMFFEVLHASTEQGDLGFASSIDGLQWKYEKIIIDEEFHLSYPRLFKWNGQYYMIPESYYAGEVRLYRATRFPSEWEFASSIIDKSHIDPTFFVHDSLCWLLAANLSRTDLHLYFADLPVGPWQEHPQSPVVSGNGDIAGPAGAVLEYDDKLYRFAMDCNPDYGNAVRVFEITDLSTTTYSESEISESPILSGTGDGWNADRMHHVDPHQLEDGSWIACVDGWRRIVQFGWKY